jgi:UTP--glucose-1-phosphate uridylyltransferase
MIEKPSIEQAPTNLAIIGRYILTNEIFSVLATTKPDKNQEIQITNALIKLALKNKVIAYKFKGKRYDCGNANGFVAANNDLYKNYNTL